MGGRRGRRYSIEDRQLAVQCVLAASQAGCRFEEACKTIGIDKRTFERWRKGAYEDLRRGPTKTPANKLSQPERDLVIKTAVSLKYRDKPASQIVPLLADEGIYLASESSFYRILKQSKLDAHRGRTKPPQKKRPQPLKASKPNQIYSWDITYLKSTISGKFFYLYCFMDIYSRKIVGYKIHAEEKAEHAANLIKQICIEENIQQNQLVLHSDNGSPMKGGTMLAMLQKLGVVPSFSRPSVSNDNPYSESLFKTTKYCHFYPSNPFDSIKESTRWMQGFVSWYNEQHLHSGIRFVTPGSRHRGEDKCILAKRNAVYESAKHRNPERWSKNTRNWSYITEVFLNPLKIKEGLDRKIAA